MPFVRRMHILKGLGMRELISSMWGRFRMPRTTATGSHHIGTSIRRDPVLWLVLCGSFLVAAIVLGTVVMVGEFRERALSNSERELENTVLLLTRHFDHQFEDSDVIANNLISQMQISEMASPEIFRSQMSSFEAHLMLQAKVGVLSYIGDVQIFDFGRKADQLVRRLAAAGRQHCRAGLFQNLQIESAIDGHPRRTGPQLFHRQLDHGNRPPAERTGRDFSRRDGAAHRPCQF